MLRLKQALADMADGPTDFPALLSLCNKREDDDDCFQIEETWRQFADKETLSQLTKKQMGQQDAIWEIIKTEVSFIKEIRIVVDFYLCALLNLQASVILNEIETESIFSNIFRIEGAHTTFWKEKLSNVVKKAREEKRLLSVMDLAEAFDGFADVFAPYTTYFITYKECTEYLKEKVKRNEVFRYFMEWAQKHPRSRRRKLQDLLSRPMGRFVKYPAFLTTLQSEKYVTMDNPSKAELSKRTSEVKGFLRRLLQNSNLEKDEEKIAVEDEVFATLNPKSPTGTPTSLSPDFIPKIVQVPKMQQLQETLNDFMVHGLQDFPALLMFSTKREEDGDCFKIEETWRAFADQEQLAVLDGKQAAQQDALWEVITAEVSLIKDIRIIVDFYSCTLLNLQASMLLNEIETEKIFGNITMIEAVHTKFWKEKLLPVIKRARTERRLPSAADMAEAFRGLVDLLAPYIKFTCDQITGMEYLRQQINENEMFRHFLDWAQRHPDSRSLKLYDLLLYPIRQLCRYPILLTAISKTVDGRPRADLLARRSTVTEFLGRLSHLADRQKGEGDESVEVVKMLKLQQTLNDFMINGLQDFPTLLAFGTKRENDDECFRIRETWRELADKQKLGEMDSKHKEHQEAIWEIIITEVCFIKDIRIIVDLYLSTLLNVQAAMLLNEMETEKIFRNITAIEQLHTRFWKTKLSNVVKKALAELSSLPSARDLTDAFKGFATHFAPYVKFCNSQYTCTVYLKQQIADNPLFALFVDWVQIHPNSGGLSLIDLLDLPIQRIAKYPVLLDALEKTLDCQSRAEVSRRKSEVKEFVMRVLPVSRHDVKRQSKETVPAEKAKTVLLHRTSAIRIHHSVSDEPADETNHDFEEVQKIKLQQTLADFMVKGIQDSPSLLSSSTKKEDVEECLQVEEVCSAWKKQADQQEAIREIITAEIGFIKDIRIVVGLYLCTLLNLQASMLLTEIETEKIFSNISAIEEIHARFWKEKLSNVVKKAQSEARLPSVLDLVEAFVGFADLFAPYVEFCSTHSERMKYLRQQSKANEMFKVFLDWVRRHPDSCGPGLEDLLDYTVERITRYPLLLTALEKTLDYPDRAKLSPRISEVTEFVARLST